MWWGAIWTIRSPGLPGCRSANRRLGACGEPYLCRADDRRAASVQAGTKRKLIQARWPGRPVSSVRSGTGGKATRASECRRCGRFCGRDAYDCCGRPLAEIATGAVPRFYHCTAGDDLQRFHVIADVLRPPETIRGGRPINRSGRTPIATGPERLRRGGNRAAERRQSAGAVAAAAGARGQWLCRRPAFPRGEGVFTGHHPPSQDDRQTRNLGRGHDFFLMPRTAFWCSTTTPTFSGISIFI